MVLESEHRNFDIRQILKTQLIIAVPAESASAEVNKAANGDDKVTERELAVSKVDENNERGPDTSCGVGDHENTENDKEVIFLNSGEHVKVHCSWYAKFFIFSGQKGCGI